MAMMGGGRGHGRGRGRHREPDSSDQEYVEPLKITDRRMIGWFAAHLKMHWLTIVVSIISMVVGTYAGLFMPLLLKSIFDDVIVTRDVGELPRLGWLLLGVFFVQQLFGAIRMNMMHRLGQRFVLDVRLETYRHLLRLSLDFFEGRRTGDIMSRLSNDVNSVEDMVVHGTDTIITDSLTVLGTIGFMFMLSPTLMLYSLLPLPIFLIAIVIFGRIIRPLYERIRENLGDINSRLQESLEAIRVVKAFSREEYERERFEHDSREYYKANIKGIWLWSSFFPAISFIMSVGMVLVIWIGAGMAVDGLTTLGTVVAFVAYLQRFYHPIGSLVRVHNTFNRALAALARIFQLMDEEPTISQKPEAVPLPRIEGRVEFDHVSFRYSTGEMILRDVSVVAEPGETVAIVGRSGAGKTSVVNLVPRLYDTLEGRVLIDGVDVRDVTLESLRSQIGIVLQETFLFNATINENIRYGRLDATDEEIVEAAKAAYASEFIDELEDGYESLIGERGVKLSGGQRQRLAIARALLADPRILILDEATSLVDTEAEQVIQKALDNLRRERTTFIIAHRLSTIRDADKIVVLDDGRIVEEDRHDELMERSGLYAEMYNRQFRMSDVWPGDGDPMGPGMSGG
jgi:ABC-type multidrug transport system fused ATPase/permease subunit